MSGGGGFVGSVQNFILRPFFTKVSALEAGYATAGTDTGHRGSVSDASWALNNDSAKQNFAGRAIHLVTDVSKRLTAHYYGRQIKHSYFMGCSTGGWQAMLASQRYPHDYDGIVAAAPDPYWITRDAYSLQLQQAMYPDPDQRATPVVSAENRTSLERRILAACDRLDGVEDGVLTDPRQCSFDPASLPHCSAGSAAECLTEDQLRVVKAVYGGLVLDNEQVLPGFSYGGENDPYGWDFSLGVESFRYFVFDDPGFGYADYDFVNWREDTAPARELMNTADTDLTAFRNGAVRSCSGTGGLIRQYLLSPRSDTTRNCNMILLLWMTLPVCICFRASTTVPEAPVPTASIGSA